MTKEFQQHITSNFPFLKNKKCLLTISGGIDSVVLAYLCKTANIDFALAHCNFNLRGEESDGDESFVRNLAKQLEVKLFVENFNTKAFAKDQQLSIQLAARKLRYEWFFDLAEKNNIEYICTAHHLNDSFETYLINTSRGTGIQGLTGIPEVNGKIIRPLLPFTRAQILQYAQKKQIKWREDSSNASDKYLRNKIRHHITPVLEEENENLLQNFYKTQQYLKDTANLLEDYTTLLFSKLVKEINGDYYLNVTNLKNTPNTKAVIYQLLHPFGFTAWEDVNNLLEAQSGKQVFSNTHRLIRDREVLILSKLNIQENQVIKIEEGQTHIKWDNKQILVKNVNTLEDFSQNIAYLSAQKISYPLTLRKWQAGDRFQPFGMKGKKKISDFLKDEKLSAIEKENTWVLLSNEEIAWVVGHRSDHRFKIEPNTTTIIKLTLTYEK
ncbi:tRNA(Ile)-lysidine synthase [Mesonia phycicola]|uniref:tRNA(Ile)-lysidine synthase n=1 Tax=Mesonia phycicola TaxID=579105 RepID=A0A1M6DW71_9FLAO|nr:tRNA lysidine(34) synthetase TilS [Mesonia phycicola]SHI77278.1 tRNA(Ile)-lysidine synthase [Mesonia phycicola]